MIRALHLHIHDLCLWWTLSHLGIVENDIVDAADYIVWRDAFGRLGDLLAADGNKNGVIDAPDYTVWRNHFGETIDSFFNAAVPEPGAAGLLVASLVAAGAALARASAEERRMRPETDWRALDRALTEEL